MNAELVVFLKISTRESQLLLYNLLPDGKLLSAFHSPSQSVYLGANGSAEVTIHFLPFQLGKRQCSVIFINEEVGEFLYAIDATATVPLSAPLPFKASAQSVRITSAAAAGRCI